MAWFGAKEEVNMLHELYAWLHGYWLELVVAYDYFVLNLLPQLVRLWAAGAALVFIYCLPHKGSAKWNALWAYLVWTRIPIALLIIGWILTRS